MKIGIDIGGTHIAIAVVDNDKIIFKNEYEYDEQFKKNIAINIINYIKNITNKMMEQYEIEKIGISVAGRLKENVLYISPNLHGLVGVNLVEELSKYFDIPITVNKDSFCAGKAEKTYGCLQNYSTAVFLIIGTGIGAISYRNNHLFRDGYGHMIIEKNGRQCKCGKKGCFETYGSITALKKEIKNYLQIERMTGKELHDYLLLHQNDEEVSKILNEYVENFCVGLSNIIDIVLPEAIGFGGSFSYYEDILLDRIKNKLSEQKLLVNPLSIPVLKMGELKNDAGIIGATLF